MVFTYTIETDGRQADANQHMVLSHTIETDGRRPYNRNRWPHNSRATVFCCPILLCFKQPSTHYLHVCYIICLAVYFTLCLSYHTHMHTHTHKQANTHILLLFDLFQILSNFVVDCILHFMFGPSLITCFKSRSLISKARYSVYNCTSNHKCTERLSNV